MDDDLDRYDSLIGWDGGEARERRERERKRRKFLAMFPDNGTDPFQRAAGTRIHTLAPKRPAAQLFGPLWTEGELAILLGPPSAGKSILAVQIADQIARGQNHLRKRVASSGSPPYKGGVAAALADGVVLSSQRSTNPFHTTAKPQKVLYIDFERTPAQFAERYSCPHPLPGKLPLRHRFPNNFTRLWLEDITDVPARFRGDLHRYLAYWIEDAIETACAPVVVIDNLSYLTRTLTRASSAGRLMKNLKLWLTRYQISILATAPARMRGGNVPGSPPYKGGVAAGRGGSLSGPRQRPATLADLPAAPIADLADTIFQISPSTLAPDLRYIKHLKSRNATLEYDEHNVLTCQITREQIIYQSPVSMSLVSSTPHSPTPFLSLSFLGLTPESIHLTDPFARPPARHPTPRPPQLKRGVVNMLLSREYWRYLER